MTTICVSDDTTEATKRLRVPSENSPPKNTKKQKEGDCWTQSGTTLSSVYGVSSINTAAVLR